MAVITDYTSLQSEIALWLDRTDLTSAIPGFVQLSEAKFNRAIRCRDNEKRSQATIAIGDQFVQLPSDFREMRNIQSNAGYGQPIRYAVDQEMDIFRAKYPEAATPRYFNVVGGEVELVPIPNEEQVLEIVYYAAIPPLASNTTNWLLDAHPDLYLFAACLEAEPYLKNDERIEVWEAKVVGFLDSINQEGERTKTRGSRLSRRVASM